MSKGIYLQWRNDFNKREEAGGLEAVSLTETEARRTPYVLPGLDVRIEASKMQEYCQTTGIPFDFFSSSSRIQTGTSSTFNMQHCMLTRIGMTANEPPPYPSLDLPPSYSEAMM